MSLSSLSISRPVTVLMFYLGIVMLGIIAFQNLAIDFLPSIRIPRLTIQTLYPNTSPDEVESRVTQPIESALNTISGVRKVSSVSREGLSVVTVEFYWSTDMDFALLDVREKLDQLRTSLPREVNRSTILKVDPSAEPIMTIAVMQEKTERATLVSAMDGNTKRDLAISSLVELKETAQALLKRRIEQIEGVAQVAVLGGVEREILVEIDTKKLQAFGITIEQVSQALANANVNLPGGTIKKGLFRYSLRTVGEFTRVNQIQDVIVTNLESGRLIRISDIGMVRDSFKERTGLTRYNGEEIISLEVRKEAGANTVTTSKKIHQVLNQLHQEYPSLKLIVLFDHAEFISQSISDVLQAIIVGALLAFLVLFFFLRNPKYPLIIGLTMPISIIATFVAMYFLHITLNVISLTGLALGIGMLGDNAIIVIENVTRLREKGMGILEAALEGAKDINLAVTASTLTNVAIFLPIIFVEGVTQQLFVDMGVTMTVALMVSLLVAVTLVPMLVSRDISFSIPAVSANKYLQQSLQQKRSVTKNIIFWLLLPFRFVIVFLAQGLSEAVLQIKTTFQKITPAFYYSVERVSSITYRQLDSYLAWGLENKKVIIGLSLLLFVVSIAAAYFIPSEATPDIDNSRFVVLVNMPKGTTLEGTSTFAKTLEHEFLNMPGIANVYSSIGITDNANFWTVSNTSIEDIRIEAKVNDNSETNTVVDAVRKRLHHFQSTVQGVEFSVKKRETTFEHILRPEQNDIKVRVIGKDPNMALTLAEEVALQLRRIEGLTDLRTTLQQGNPEYTLVVDREQASRYGLSVQQVAQSLAAQVKGIEATFFNDFDRKITIRVQPSPTQRKNIEEILSTSIKTTAGAVPLREVVRWKQTNGNAEIWRENQQRAVVMTANVSGRSVGSVVQDIQQKIDSFSLPSGYSISIGGENEEIRRSFNSLFLIIILSLFLVYMILAAEYESILYPLVILLTSPLAFIGAIASMAVAGQQYNIMSLIGIVIMIGAVDNDAVIAVDLITALRREGKNLREAITTGMKQRLRPILITTATTVLGMIPLIFEFGTGSELVRALTIPLVGGMISSTLFTVVAIPIVYTYIDTLAIGKKG